MLNAVLLTVAALANIAQNIITGIYNKKKGNIFIFNLFSALAVMLFFVFASGLLLSFKLETALWAFFFALSYMACGVGLVLAVKFGGVSLTSLVISYSLVIPTVFGIIAYGEHPSWFFYFGLALLIVSLFFIGVPRKGSSFKITPLWVISVLIAFVGNGLCSLFQSHYQRLSGGQYRSEFMIIAMGMTIVMCLIAILVTRKSDERTVAEKKAILKSSLIYGGLKGIFNGVVNLLIMILVSLMSVSLIFPLFSAISLVATIIASRIIFKEIPDKLTTVGLVIGVVAIVFLNL